MPARHATFRHAALRSITAAAGLMPDVTRTAHYAISLCRHDAVAYADITILLESAALLSWRAMEGCCAAIIYRASAAITHYAGYARRLSL